MSGNAIYGPILTEKVIISPKRFINLKLGPPSFNSRWGSSNSSIEFQEARRLEENQWGYSLPIRISCDASTALLVNLISYFLIEGRKINHQFKNNVNLYNSEEKKATYELNSNSTELDIEKPL